MVVVKAAVFTVVVAVVVMAMMVEVEELVGETEMIGCHSLPLYTVKPLVLPCMYID